jgi:hypothetical protein
LAHVALPPCSVTHPLMDDRKPIEPATTVLAIAGVLP